MDEIEGEIRFHHLLPGLRVMEARECAHRWVVFHDCYDFCLVEDSLTEPVRWKYNHEVYTVDRDHLLMAMQPGELHANLKRTPPGTFLVVQVEIPLMRRMARELGWKSDSLNIGDPATTDPRLRRALSAFRAELCDSAGGACVCATRPGVHAENLFRLVTAVLQGCAEGARELGAPGSAPAIVRRAREYLVANHQRPYRLAELTRECGAEGPSYLLHAFKRAYNVSPSDFQRQVLVAKTCEALVQDPSRPLEQIAREVGWVGRVSHARKASTLIRHFRRSLGITPARFRGSLRSLSEEDWKKLAEEALEGALRSKRS